MKRNRTSSAAYSPRIQRNWDWRAAGNFIGGGAGSGLIISATLMSPSGFDALPFVFLGLILVAAGLFCVWLEIGRPWRALNVLKHFSTSWMSREAWVAPLLFFLGILTLLFEPLLVWLVALLAAAFLYSQSRILRADKGIPAWRHPRAGHLVVLTGLTEGCGLLVLLLPLFDQLQWVVWGVFLLLLAGRAVAWRVYREGLAQAKVPQASQKRLAGIDREFLLVGHVLPALLLAMALIVPEAAMLAGLLGMLAGAWMKYNLITRAAFTQGFTLQHAPVRGQPAPQSRPALN
ncbi:MAG: dimethyl sulfoxide reductase anchor subunit [Sedimenticola sp.]|uniref:Phenylacetyl-CoA:acceptor oxidoreductase n=1 Tax=Sedimenticola thiotaurini TaxID=1543721 RepID=A0A558DDM7_9GAMM|nr:dimethyl sulfoxide reductase anchor subunit [Sedimenticola sp.]TVT59132.1 MAG: phenylacetyl-CoA:acceptor oxidoreductase [Sedimenticola thiotaurini]MCW8947566.1 dimethyl sulfoxide reductase anchor subunit [Sedimenticola sp.]MCW8948343.1 dimethyl sulfoxide reductase anchor subunit [Sedimenticola sp.]MCW8976015.1 dimethyl sulfoxide reductase anchor subunit [Sedimenticola sp.]